MSAIMGRLLSFEEAFRAEPLSDWMKEHMEVPAAAVAAYLLLLAAAPRVVKAPFPVKHAFTAWNLALSLFSVAGACRLVPPLLSTLAEKGFTYTVCEEPSNWYTSGPRGFWIMAFILSKFPELGDTAFLVLRKKPVIFLHWYHHATVLLYCWHAGVVRAAPGLWFGAMNFSVHSVMYLYFALANAGYHRILRPVAPFITSIQILQMVGGIICLSTVAALQMNGHEQECAVDPTNWKLGLAMYFSYFVLFAWLFLDKYSGKQTPAAKSLGQTQSGALPSGVAGKTHAE